MRNRSPTLIADAARLDLLRLENLDIDILPEREAVLCRQRAAAVDAANSYLVFVGRCRLRDITARHVAQGQELPIPVSATASHRRVAYREFSTYCSQ